MVNQILGNWKVNTGDQVGEAEGAKTELDTSDNRMMIYKEKH